MPENSTRKKKDSSSKNIEIPPIPKQTAGAVAGAAAGSIAGPLGAVVGGVVGAIAGKAAEKRRAIAPVTTRSTRNLIKSPKSALGQRQRKKSVAKKRESATRSGGKAKRPVSHRSTTIRSRKKSPTRRSHLSRAAWKRAARRKKRR